jgi:4-hydroxybenzoate polyprenyltransferase
VSRAVVETFEAFAALCLAASATYLFNDVRDRESDRAHPTKCQRAIASGLVAPSVALPAALVAAAAGIGIAFKINRTTGLVVLGYLALTTLYSLVLKHLVILDVLAVAGGFVLRVIVGAEAINVWFSSWLVLCTFLVALFLGFGKRRHELVLLEGNANTHRPILGEYSPHFLDMMMAVVTAATVMSYVLYTMDAETLARFHGRRLIYTSVFVLYGIFRYLYLIHQKSAGGNPVDLLYRDRSLLVAVSLWVVSVIALRYA